MYAPAVRAGMVACRMPRAELGRYTPCPCWAVSLKHQHGLALQTEIIHHTGMRATIIGLLLALSLPLPTLAQQQGGTEYAWDTETQRCRSRSTGRLVPSSNCRTAPPAQPMPPRGHTIGTTEVATGNTPDLRQKIEKLDANGHGGSTGPVNPPVRPPEGAQFVSVSGEPGGWYFPIACEAWFAHRVGLRWHATELDARNAGLEPSPHCLNAPRYEAPRTTVVPSSPVRRPSPPPPVDGPRLTRPIQNEDESPAAPIVWAQCDVLFVTGPRSLLCRDGRTLVLDPNTTKTQTREALAQAHPPGTTIYAEVIRQESKTLFGKVIDKPKSQATDQDADRQPGTVRQGPRCQPFHGRWLCN